MEHLPSKESFSQWLDGKEVKLLYLKNKLGWTAALTNYGARLVSLWIPNIDGKLINVVSGFNSLSDYLNATEYYYGATVGRYANRIANATFRLANEEYRLDSFDPAYCLHGGPKGFHAQVWNVVEANEEEVVFSYTSPDGEMGFPGNLEVKVIYTMTHDGVCIRYEASTDQPTVCNLTHHSFFNLNGSGSIEKHELLINADYYLPLNSHLVPTGQLASVAMTPFDFRKTIAIGERIEFKDPQLIMAGGYDHNYVLVKGAGQPAAIAKGDRSGIVMRLYTDKPGLQLYTGNGLTGKNKLSNGDYDLPKSSFCLEPQYFPNSPNEPTFPSALLRPEEHYRSFTELKFSSGLL